MAERVIATPTELRLLEKLHEALDMLPSLPFQVNLWRVQNICYDLLKSVYPEFKAKADQGDETARQWVEHFVPLSERLSVQVR
jgi:hypothetical protein